MVSASYQIRKIAGCACARNAGNVFPTRRLQRKPPVSDPGMHHGTCVTHVPWCMSGSLTCAGRENVPGIPQRMRTRNFTYLARGPSYNFHYRSRWTVKLSSLWYSNVFEKCHMICVILRDWYPRLGVSNYGWINFEHWNWYFSLASNKSTCMGLSYVLQIWDYYSIVVSVQIFRECIQSVRISCIKWWNWFKCHPSNKCHATAGAYYFLCHLNYVIMGAISSQITSLMLVFSTVYSAVDHRKHQSSASLAFVRGMASNAENVSIWWRHHV